MSHYGIMATQFLAMLTTVHHHLKCGIVVYLANLRHPFHSIPLDVCFVCQLERCFNVSLRELILSCSTFEKIDPSRVPFSSRCHVGWSSQSKTSRQDDDRIKVLMKCNLDREDCASLHSPFTLAYAWISRRDFCLVGVSCHIPSFWCCLVFASCLNFETWTEEIWKPQKLK